MKRLALIATLMGSTLALMMPFAASAQNGQYATRISFIMGIDSNRIMLDNGMTVFLHEGTIISPTGASLIPGMRIRVSGMRQSHYRLDARVIDLPGQYRH